MIEFLKLQWKLGKINEAYLTNLANKGRITETEKTEIMDV